MRMTGRHGEKRSSKVPDDVKRPTENRSPYPSSVSAGDSSPPSATIVTPEAPVNVVKMCTPAP